MKKLLLFFAIIISFQFAFAQPAGMLNETFRLKSIRTNGQYFTPNGENPNITITDNSGNHIVEANGISNTLSALATFSGNLITFDDITVTADDCTVPECYYEDLYFYDILTTLTLDSKTFTYYYSESNGYKYLRLKDSNINFAYFSTEPVPVADTMLFQTWYLFMQEGDLGDPIFYDGPNPPQITISPDLTFTGVEDCATISGDFILGVGDIYDFMLQPQNYSQDESNCPPGPVNYAMHELYSGNVLDCIVYEGNDGNDYFQFEYAPGFISHFSNEKPLSIAENILDNLKIFPNPASDKLIIQSAINNFDTISIADINGRTIISNKNLVLKEIDVSTLKAGMYFITVTSSEGKVTKKFIKN